MLALSPTKRLTEFLTGATSRGVDVSLVALFEIFGLPPGESTLAKVVAAGQFLDALGLALAPDLTKGELDTPRRVFPKEGAVLTPDVASAEVENDESSDLELKSSLMYHHAKAAANPGCPIHELKSEEVENSALKTIAAFLTSRGGLLYVGIDDGRKILGIEPDFTLLGPGRQNQDGWEQQLRNLVTSRFKDGDNVNDYVRPRFVTLDGKWICRVEVGPRTRLSFLKHKNAYHLYRRQGNRTEEVGIDQVEEFLLLRSARV